VAAYRVFEQVRLETHHPLLGQVAAAFKAGEVEPKSEQEEAALGLLVEAGLAEALPERAGRRRAKE
jgi:hypothetical protein